MDILSPEEKRKREEETKRKGGEKALFALELAKIGFLAILIVVPIKIFVFQPFIVKGASMEPNFYNKEYLIVNELGYKTTAIAGEVKVSSFREFDRGDVVVFRFPNNPKKYYIKRVIGLPGEKVSLRNGQVTIFNNENPKGFVLDESGYLPSTTVTTGEKDFKLAEGEYVVFGDNRTRSSDSRDWGVLDEEFVTGKVLLRLLPFGRVSVF